MGNTPPSIKGKINMLDLKLIKIRFTQFGLGLILSTISLHFSYADTLDDTSGRYFITGQEIPLPYVVLGPACYSIRLLKHLPPCNPAQLVTQEGHQFGANLTIGEDYQFLSRNEDLIRGDNKKDLAQRLLYENKNIRFEGSSQIYFLFPAASVSLQPARWTYFSGLINSSYPDLAIHAMQEQGVQVQFGTALDENFSLGVSLRAFERKFVHEIVNVFDAVSYPENYFNLKTQQVYFIQPGLLYEFGNNENSYFKVMSFSFHISNIGVREGDKSEKTYKDPVYDFGWSVSPEVSDGLFEWSLSYRYVELLEAERRVRLALAYQIDTQTFLLSVAENETSIGAFSDFFFLQSGLMLRRRHEPKYPGDNKNDDSLSIEISTNF